jgi:hypothetical protein
MIKQAKNLCKGDVIYDVCSKKCFVVLEPVSHYGNTLLLMLETESGCRDYMFKRHDQLVPVIAQSEVHRDINRS